MLRHKLSVDDREFRAAFEAGAFAPADFSHRAHVRLAYVYLAESDVDLALERMRAALIGFLCVHGLSVSKYHATLTRAWILAVDHFMHRSREASSGDDFIARNPLLLDTKIMLTHYSADLLFSDQARAEFVEPNLDPIPRHHAA
ncbi:MAG TPA: hypothetical protein VGO61_05800 [Steroidobacteraceae bacterium]|jgi:hypothetical protein|nr:hypothetical protein [Steroidobacteraceae bacterium]